MRSFSCAKNKILGMINETKNCIWRWMGFACRIIFGALFIFSGFVKAIDPLGFSYKMHDYLEAWNLTQFDPLTLVGAIGMSALEFAIGCCILFGIRLREAAWVGLAFMLFYTPLTLWIAIENPVSDCGCFGDAIVITNWQTFWKNAILLTLAIIILKTEKLQHSHLSPLPSWLLVGAFFAVSVALSLYCLRYLPIIDFRPYKIGANISEGMTIPEGAETDVYETTYTYAHNGVEQQFSQAEFIKSPYLWEDSTWHFVTQESKLVRKGYTPPIHDFVLTTRDGDDITADVLADEGPVYLIIMYDLEKTDTAHLDALRQLYATRTAEGAKFYALTASYDELIDRFVEQTQLPFDFCTADPIMLKTVVRANPGIVVLKNGTVIDKYSHARIPQ